MTTIIRVSEQQSPKFEVGPIKKEQHECMSCSSPFATAWSTTEGKAWLCRECANLHGLGCP